MDTDLFIFCCPKKAKFILSKSLTKPVLRDNAEIIFLFNLSTKISDTVSITIGRNFDRIMPFLDVTVYLNTLKHGKFSTKKIIKCQIIV
jgi:hypothetical protein